MFYSRCLLTSKGPLGAIWVAAYSFKRLKKARVKETDISSSVDHILQDEMNFVTYRVLAYLLLGVVRIYSKKVEYLFNDCNEVLFQIKKFVINTKNSTLMETLRMPITLPKRFELDAFDLDILEDAGGGNVASLEEITLKDVLWKNKGIGLFSLDEYQLEESNFCENTHSADPIMLEDINRFHLMDIDLEVSSPCSPVNLQASKETFEDSIFSQEKTMRLDTVNEEEHTEPVNLFIPDRQINEEQVTVQETAPCEDEIHGERSIEKIRFGKIYEEESVDISMLCGWGEDIAPVEPIKEFHQVDADQVKAKETVSSEYKMHKEIGEVLEVRNTQVAMEKPQDDKFYQGECMDYEKFSVADKRHEEINEGSVEENYNGDNLAFQEKNSIEDTKFESINVAVTPKSKFLDGSGSRPKSGGTTQDLMLISTPAVTERAHFSRKRKCVIDESIVLPNKVLRQSIEDATDLISKRRKTPHTFRAAWRAARISSLPEGFYGSLLPCHSLKFRSLFSKTNFKIRGFLETVEALVQLDKSESETVCRLEHEATAPKTPPQHSTIRSIESPKVPNNARPSSPHEIVEREQSLKRGDKHKSLSMPTELKNNLDEYCVGTSNSYESMWREQSLRNDEELILMNECCVGTSNSYESIERDQNSRNDEELILMNEDINLCEIENSELLGGWSGRTRKFARYLHRSFLDPRKQQGEEVVNFTKVLGGRTTKECARLFFEILVLRTTSCVDVMQNEAYGDISVWKLPKLDQFCTF